MTRTYLPLEYLNMVAAKVYNFRSNCKGVLISTLVLYLNNNCYLYGCQSESLVSSIYLYLNRLLFDSGIVILDYLILDRIRNLT